MPRWVCDCKASLISSSRFNINNSVIGLCEQPNELKSIRSLCGPDVLTSVVLQHRITQIAGCSATGADPIAGRVRNQECGIAVPRSGWMDLPCRRAIHAQCRVVDHSFGSDHGNGIVVEKRYRWCAPGALGTTGGVWQERGPGGILPQESTLKADPTPVANLSMKIPPQGHSCDLQRYVRGRRCA